ncbi:ABC transporter substrate-binding protein [Streptosporangium roseum]|uniref:ABC-type branched-chain amino acid transport systems periplasmic component-like protein n=1 Tax=Streptosporangium roseum (strain ATCC 12428 / DSM 43021 / JCM 3005 / KCTC 9067 / NCIMB 10171 / NRRL 2505 / NI 9100) TaxID=479432 RepID=D2AW14_STRRD|nr:ABC transporter substrate-binding protein [Streptosporangium roseum]ACZ84967.1 ABC-type branched-chain amino acid transport systems periplasmic component-like protein [Streptosporangium roseum DSM 43021]
MRRQAVRLIGLVSAAALVAGCAAAQKNGTGAPGEAAGAAGVTGTTVTVGGVLTKTSASGYSTKDAEIGARARFQRANEAGGVHGRRIEFAGAEDDNQDAAKGDAAAKKLVQRDKVFALVPVHAPNFGGATFLEQQGVPWFGWATGPQWCGTETGFGYNGCLAPKPGAGSQTWWGNQMAELIGGSAGKSVYVQTTDSSGSKYGGKTISQSFQAAGFTLAGLNSGLPAAAPPPDWLPYVNKIMTSDGGEAPDLVVSIIAGTKFNTGLYAALKKAGYKGLLSDATSYDAAILKDPATARALEGVIAAPMFEPFESQAPEIAQLKADVEKAAPGTALTQHLAIGYWAADIFLKVLEQTGRDLTRERFLATANGSFTYENAGFGRIQYPKDHTEPNGCGALVKLEGGAFKVAKNMKCFDNVPLK